MNDLIHRIVGVIIEAGQSDTKKFSLGETIRYSPSEILEILKQHENEIFGEESSAQTNTSNTLNALDMIYRQAAIDAVLDRMDVEKHGRDAKPEEIQWALEQLPSAQPERDIPMKPNETIDTAWGIRKKQAVCPKCDYYLGYVEFIGNPNGKKITYCETCGQAIDWEGWEWE